MISPRVFVFFWEELPFAAVVSGITADEASRREITDLGGGTNRRDDGDDIRSVNASTWLFCTKAANDTENAKKINFMGRKYFMREIRSYG